MPKADSAKVDREKITDYLLNFAHVDGASKARFFSAFGFQREAWEELAVSLLEHGRRNEVIRTRNTPFGPRYEIVGPLTSPDGRSPTVRTVWQWDDGELASRLITAYPETE